MRQRHEQLPAPAAVLTHVILHDCVAPAKPVLAAQPVEDPLGGVTLLARLTAVVLQPLVNELGEPVELRPTHLPPCADTPAAPRTAASSSRSRAQSRNAPPLRARSSPPGTPGVPCDTAPRCESLRPLRRRKGPHWQSFTPPQRDHPAASVVYFCTAVLKIEEIARAISKFARYCRPHQAKTAHNWPASRQHTGCQWEVLLTKPASRARSHTSLAACTRVSTTARVDAGVRSMR